MKNGELLFANCILGTTLFGEQDDAKRMLLAASM